jgi:hypothetical protein
LLRICTQGRHVLSAYARKKDHESTVGLPRITRRYLVLVCKRM